MLEFEKKVMLTHDEYLLLKEQCKKKPAETQINYYFDTDDLSMNKKGITCRIRAKNGEYKTTLKKHCRENSCCSVEAHICRSTEINTDFFDALGLHFQGELVTLRICMFENKFCKAVLDKNFYLGHTDFELEVEYSTKNEKRALKYLKGVAKRLLAEKLIDSEESFLLRIGKGASKSERFFNKKNIFNPDTCCHG